MKQKKLVRRNLPKETEPTGKSKYALKLQRRAEENGVKTERAALATLGDIFPEST